MLFIGILLPGVIWYISRYLSHKAEWNFPLILTGPVHFPFKPCWVVFFHFYSNFKRNFCKQTVENLIRRRVLRRLMWFCTVCRSATERTLGFYGLTNSLEKKEL